MNIGDWLFKRSFISPEKTAILFHDRELGYSQMNKRVNRLCHGMLKMGLSKGDRVGVLCRNRPEFLEIYFACSKTGAIFVPLNFRLAPPELAFQIDDSGTKILFLHSDFHELVMKSRMDLPGDGPTPIILGEEVVSGRELCYTDFIKNESEDEPLFSDDLITLDTAQMIMYTSGTTGRPKGALLSHKKTLFNTLNAQIYFDLYSKDVMLLALPLFHSGGLNIMAVPTLYAGGTIILMSRFDPEEFLELVEAHKVTQAMLVPTMLNTILKESRPEDFNLGSLRSILIGGEPASADLVHEAQDRGLPVRQIFGQTETSIELWVPKAAAREKAGSVGIPVFHGEVVVKNDSKKAVQPGEIGEIVVKGPIQMMSYWNSDEATHEVLKDGWLHTRDLGKLDEDGFFYAVDRMGDMYISGGENVYPAEVEKALFAHPQIFEAAIIGVPSEKWGMAGHALIRCKKGETIDMDEVVAFLGDKVASYKIPETMAIVDKFSKTASGKIKKKEFLRSMG
ncbi:MAG: long-chain fatty acid--CoA ligase [Deltaproteobacteria bacterium]|nr:long-chain fatty acid--CoA ligase [Deltaproteobacteria bacterium]